MILTKARLLEAAGEEFAEKGFERATDPVDLPSGRGRTWRR